MSWVGGQVLIGSTTTRRDPEETTMASNLEDFVYRLANDQDLLDQFRSDPHGVLAGSGLSGPEKDLVLSGDADQISAALGSKSAVVVVVVSASRG
jgi:hypothetical protein